MFCNLTFSFNGTKLLLYFLAHKTHFFSQKM